MEVIAGILFLAVLIEGTLTYLFGDDPDAKAPRWWLGYTSLGFGVVLAIFYQVDIPSMFGLTALTPIANYVVSGIIIGRGSNYANDILGAMRGTR